MQRLAMTVLVAWIALGCSDDESGGGAGGNAGSGASGGGAGTAGGSGGSAGAAGAPACDAACLSEGFSCCGSTCVNSKNDPKNCGTCGNACPSSDPFCDNGTCGQPPCPTPPPCQAEQFCCGDQCCSGICCAIPGPVGVSIECVDPATTAGSCPLGCLTCKCADPDTAIATPNGERRIDSLRAGDLVYSVHRDAIVAVPVLRTNRTPVSRHHVLEITLTSGAVLRISGGHPTADGRRLDALAVGARLGEATVAAIRDVPYDRPYTVDVLPDSDSGAYFASGALIGSTLAALR